MATLLLLLVTPFFYSPVKACDCRRKPGVKRGDLIVFRFTETKSTNNPEVTGNLSIIKTWTSHYVSKMEIFAVDGMNIIIKETRYIWWQHSFWFFFDISLYTGFLLFVAANLYAGYKLNINPECNLMINATLKRVHRCVEREVNYVTARHNEIIDGWYEEHSIEAYWDRETGVMCEKIDKCIRRRNSYSINTTKHVLMLKTNMWECSEHHPTDLNRDCFVGIDDLIICAEAFGSDSTILTDRWNSSCDVDEDRYVGIKDMMIITKDFGCPKKIAMLRVRNARAHRAVSFGNLSFEGEILNAVFSTLADEEMFN